MKSNNSGKCVSYTAAPIFHLYIGSDNKTLCDIKFCYVFSNHHKILQKSYFIGLRVHATKGHTWSNGFSTAVDSVRPKPGFGIGNRNQDQVSVSVSGPELFLPKPKLSPILKSTQNSVQQWPER